MIIEFLMKYLVILMKVNGITKNIYFFAVLVTEPNPGLVNIVIIG